MSETPLTDFIATLADPKTLDRFRADSAGTASAAGLSNELLKVVISGHPGAIRVRSLKELEAAGLAPIVSDKFGLTANDPKRMTSGDVTVASKDDIGAVMVSTYTSTTNDTTTNTNTTNDTTTNTNTTNDMTTNDMSTNDAINGGDARSLANLLESIEQSIRVSTTDVFSKTGQLMVVGGGIRAISDMTLDAEAQVRVADQVLYCVADPVTERRLHSLNRTAKSLYDLYGNGKPRMETYKEMIDKILGPVRAGLRVCVVFYGHPGVFAWSTHQAVRIARREGFRAEMHAGISADASLFADIGIDPSSHGCHSLEATDFLIRRRTPDVGAHFLLWQVECVGDFGFNFAGYKRHNFHILIERLRMFYPREHPVFIYQATQLPQGRPQIIKSSLDSITSDKLTGIATLYLPPVEIHQVDAEMCERLGV